jgi:hypothetical protein
MTMGWQDVLTAKKRTLGRRGSVEVKQILRLQLILDQDDSL